VRELGEISESSPSSDDDAIRPRPNLHPPSPPRPLGPLCPCSLAPGPGLGATSPRSMWCLPVLVCVRGSAQLFGFGSALVLAWSFVTPEKPRSNRRRREHIHLDHPPHISPTYLSTYLPDLTPTYQTNVTSIYPILNANHVRPIHIIIPHPIQLDQHVGTIPHYGKGQDPFDGDEWGGVEGRECCGR